MRILLGEPARTALRWQFGSAYRRPAYFHCRSDSEGTLGGLVALGQPEHLRRLLDSALEDARRCSSDPLCAEHVPDLSDTLHNAACHACLFASETSCEAGNRWLDRGVLVALPDTEDLAFPL
jgi:hypothetical protein